MNNQPLRLLLLDDDEAFAEGVAAWLAAVDWLPSIAYHPEQATRLLEQQEFDLLLADIHLPGQRPLQWVESALRVPNIPPLFVMTGSPAFESAWRAANLPVSGYLIKPFDFLREAPRLRAAALAHRRHRLPATILRGLATELAGLDSPSATDPSPALQSLEDTARDDLPATAWRDAVLDTIQVLRRTKRSFHSKDLGELRIRLQRLVDSAPAPPSPPHPV